MLSTLSDFDRVPFSNPAPKYCRPAGRVGNYLGRMPFVSHARDLVIWTVGEPLVTIRGGRCKHSGERSTQDIHSIIACDGKVVTRRVSQTPPLTNPALFKRDGNTCLYCAKHLPDADLTRDHVVPVSRGGADSWDNVVASCRRCNHLKGNRVLEEINLELLALSTYELLRILGAD